MITDEMFKKGKFWTDGPMVVTGCTKVSPGCKHCWSEKFHVRQSKGPNSHIWPSDCLTDGKFNGKVHFNLNALEKAVKGKKPKVIAIWNDLYHEGVNIFKIGKVHRIAEKYSHHIFLFITKRIDRAADYCESVSEFAGVPVPDNIWHIATMENQKMVDKRMGDLLRIPGKRGIIIEPMLEYTNLQNCREGRCNIYNTCGGASNPHCEVLYKDLKRIHQVILGPENGTGKRHFDPAWAESVKAQCAVAGVPFYRKDRGEGELSWR